MFTEELQTIRQAEERADTIRKDAKTEAARLMKDANTKAGKIADEAEINAKTRYEAFLAEGQQTAQAEYENAIADAKKTLRKDGSGSRRKAGPNCKIHSRKDREVKWQLLRCRESVSLDLTTKKRSL